MRCLHCGKQLGLIEKLKDREFCSELHRKAFQQDQEKLSLARLLEAQQHHSNVAARMKKKKAEPAGFVAYRLTFHLRRSLYSLPLVPIEPAGGPLRPARDIVRDRKALLCGVSLEGLAARRTVRGKPRPESGCAQEPAFGLQPVLPVAQLRPVRENTVYDLPLQSTMDLPKPPVRRSGSLLSAGQKPAVRGALNVPASELALRPALREQSIGPLRIDGAVPVIRGLRYIPVEPAAFRPGTALPVARLDLLPPEHPVATLRELVEAGPTRLAESRPESRPRLLESAPGIRRPAAAICRLAPVPRRTIAAPEFRPAGRLGHGETAPPSLLRPRPLRAPKFGRVAGTGVPMRLPRTAEALAEPCFTPAAGKVPIPLKHPHPGPSCLAAASPRAVSFEGIRPGPPSTHLRLGASHLVPAPARTEGLAAGATRASAGRRLWRPASLTPPVPPIGHRSIDATRPPAGLTLAAGLAPLQPPPAQASSKRYSITASPEPPATSAPLLPGLVSRMNPGARSVASASGKLLSLWPGHPVRRAWRAAGRPAEWLASQPALLPKLRLSVVGLQRRRTSADLPDVRLQALGSALAPLARFWNLAPSDLKWMAMAMPLLVGLAVYSLSSPKAAGPAVAASPSTLIESADSVGSTFGSALEQKFEMVRTSILSRAAINLHDDFREGLSQWEGEGEWARSWSYDQAGFVHPGRLALYRPTRSLTDYRMEFLAQPGRKSLPWVIRAKDPNNYYALKLVLTRSGPLPSLALVRYPVLDGKPGPVVQLPVPLTVRNDTMFRVGTEVSGPNFTVRIQGQVAATWTDERFRSGGVGFFSERGDQSRIRWVEISHQYDMLGRLCAFLAPYHIQD